MKLQSYLGRTRHLGSTNDGVNHWWSQRLTAIALVPLAIWFVISLLGLVGADYAGYKAWLSQSPANVALLSLFVIVVFHHAQLGLSVVLEDYVHCECKKIVSLIAVKFAAAFLGMACLVSVFSVAFGG